MGGKQNISPRERICVEKYLHGMSLKKSMEFAGYSTKSIHVFRFLQKRQLVEFIRQRREEIAAAASLDSAELITAARRILSENKYDRIKALEILMRLCVPEAAEVAAVSSDKKSINISFAPATLPEKDD